MNNKVEYKALKVKRDSQWFKVNFDSDKMETELNCLGAEGWDLVSCVDINVGYGTSQEIVFLFKKYIN